MAVQIPKIRAVPVTADPNLAGFLQDLRSAVMQVSSASPPPQPISNLTATPVSGGIVVQFTRSNAVNFRLFTNSTNDLSTAQIVDLGSNNKYTDTLGSGGVTRYYWVQAINPNSPQPSMTIGPVSAASLALGTSSSVIPPNQPSYATVKNATTGQSQPAIYATDFTPAGKQAQ